MGIDIELQGSINLPQEINKNNKKNIRGMGNPPDVFLPSNASLTLLEIVFLILR